MPDLDQILRTRLAEIIENETSVISAFAYSPLAIPYANYPACIVYRRNGAYDYNGFGAPDMPFEDRVIYDLIVIAAPTESGASEDIERLVSPLFTEFPQLFIERDTLQYPKTDLSTSLDFVQRVRLLNNTGIVNLNMIGWGLFMGVSFTLEITYLVYS